MMCSIILPKVTTAVKESDSFKNRKRRDNTCQYIYSQLYNKEVLTKTYHSIDKLSAINKKELIHCKNIL